MPGMRPAKAKGPWVGSDAVGAPTDAQYVTLALNAGLSQERVLTAGTGISIVDGGADGPVTINNTGAPVAASFLVVALDGVLTNERQITAGAGIAFVDAGPNGNFTISATGMGTTPFVTLIDAAPIVVDAALGVNFKVTLTASRLLQNPSNPSDGQLIRIRVTQGGIGSYVLTFDTKYRFGTDLPSPILSTAVGAIDYLGFIYHEIDDKWDYVSQVFGF